MLVVVDLISRLHFYVKAAMGLVIWPCFFIGVGVGLAVSLGRVNGLAIGEAVLTGADVADGFSRLFLC